MGGGKAPRLLLVGVKGMRERGSDDVIGIQIMSAMLEIPLSRWHAALLDYVYII
jgi:hypothetical protein